MLKVWVYKKCHLHVFKHMLNFIFCYEQVFVRRITKELYTDLFIYYLLDFLGVTESNEIIHKNV